jgi:KRAB domain-containing zinc finger protein
MRCRICNQLFEKADFLKHKHDEGPKLQCDHCGAQFHATTDLSSHMLVHKEFLEFQCEICREKFKHLHLLKLHAKSHDKPRENYQKCRICKLSFRNVKLHMAMHKTISEKFKCPKCPKYFSTKQLLGFHLDRHAKPFQCDICGDSLGSKAILERHFFMHAAKTYKCRLCPKKFSSEVYLTNHLERHSNERPYKCDKCPKAYKTNDVLRQHLKTHQEKKHECPKCPKKFTLLHHLNDHILTHDKSRSVQCPECGLSLSSKLTLSRHIRYKHSTERNYPCKICSRSFKIHADLTKHLERHENSQKFECETCHREFTNKTYFQRHLKIHENWKKK